MLSAVIVVLLMALMGIIQSESTEIVTLVAPPFDRFYKTGNIRLCTPTGRWCYRHDMCCSERCDLSSGNPFYMRCMREKRQERTSVSQGPKPAVDAAINMSYFALFAILLL